MDAELPAGTAGGPIGFGAPEPGRPCPDAAAFNIRHAADTTRNEHARWIMGPFPAPGDWSDSGTRTRRRSIPGNLRSAAGLVRNLRLADFFTRAHRKQLVVLEAVAPVITMPPKIEVDFRALRQPELRLPALEIDRAVIDRLMLLQELNLRQRI